MFSTKTTSRVTSPHLYVDTRNQDEYLKLCGRLLQTNKSVENNNNHNHNHNHNSACDH